MKKTLFALAFAAATLQMSAQTQKPRMTAEQRTEQRVKKMTEELKLTTDQQSQILKLYTDMQKQNVSRENRKEAMQKLETSIMQVLTPEQQTTYKQLKEQQKAQRKQQGPRGGQRPNSQHDEGDND